MPRAGRSSSSVFCCLEGVLWGWAWWWLKGVRLPQQPAFCREQGGICLVNLTWTRESSQWIKERRSLSSPYKAISMRHFLCLFFTPVLREFCSEVAPKGFPGGLDGKEPACQCRRPGLDPRVGKISWRRKWQPTPVLEYWKTPWTEEPGGCSPRGRRVGHAWGTELRRTGHALVAPDSALREGGRGRPHCGPSRASLHPLPRGPICPPRGLLRAHWGLGTMLVETLSHQLQARHQSVQDPRTQGLCSRRCRSEILISASTAWSGVTTDTLP